ncbi:helicase HerA-like C-terminal domain-containing protein [Mesorhizobium sp. M4B.F.Ca.ET.058.02.1.1]|uniref:helicase HerA-like C-terminal domain-containing protein n=1 Tax=Mesorhizobium sp. M4B.F.Ca.ET.058.02.1.1 TaxID=2493675 RepID=UPI001FDFB70D|nr:helicase HerA-like C-terminal domain-containing protein [Mesorhizobium sp. M4B.F.Ca.ET.058.02.1.1]
MADDKSIFIGASRKPDDSYQRPEQLLLQYGNRHGLITGATGTGKTVSLQILAEGFSNAGVPVFCADIKGDLSGIAMMGEAKDFLVKRAEQVKLEPYDFQQFPVIFWDLFGEQGHPIRATISEMGPLLLSRLMNLTEAQEGIMNIAFRIADEEGLLLLDLKDLQALLANIAERADELSARYGNVTKPSVGAIQRTLLVLEQQGAANFFGEPALRIADIMRTTRDGRGAISVLAADKLMMNPRLYATFLLWLMSELFEELPEVGDPERPKLVFFFDEAHLLFEDAPKVLIDRVEQVVRLIRSKGVGVYFVTQNPLDIPEKVLAQLGNRVQHALRAYTPREQQAVRTAADTFRPNPDFDCATAITQLGTGEALVSTLETKGVPSMVQRTLIRPPSSRLGPITPDERRQLIAESPVTGQYDQTIDRESAFEMLQKKAREAQEAEQQAQQADSGRSRWTIPGFGDDPAPQSGGRRAPAPRPSNRQTVAEAAIKSVVRSVGSSVGRAIVRGILGSLARGGRMVRVAAIKLDTNAVFCRNCWNCCDRGGAKAAGRCLRYSPA